MARVLIATSFGLEASALQGALSQAHEVRCRDATTPDSLCDEVARWRPDALIVDASLPPSEFRQVCGTAAGAGARVIALADAADHQCLIASLEAGVQGFVTKEDSLAELSTTIMTVTAGGAAVPSRMLGGLLLDLVARRRESDSGLEKYYLLSRREKEVLVLLAEGLDHHGIAQRLVISPQTARTHLQNAMSKLGVHSRLEAASFVLRHGLAERFGRSDP